MMNVGYLLKSCAYFLIFVIGFLYTDLRAQSDYIEKFLSYEVDVKDWGLKKASDVKYLTLGVLNKKKGDDLVVYDMRKSVPSADKTLGSRGRKPIFEGNQFVVSNYDEGNTNVLGGYFFAFKKAPTNTQAEIDDKVKALKFSYNHEEPAFGGLSLQLYNYKLPTEDQLFLDAREFKYLHFKVKGAKGGEKFVLRIGDRINEQAETSANLGELENYLPAKKVTKNWQEVWLKLDDLPKGIRIKELATVILLVNGTSKGTIYVKDLAFTTKKGVKIKKAVTQLAKKSTNKKMREGMWLWETEDLIKSQKEQNRLVEFCKAQGITDLFLQIPYKATKVLSNKRFEKYMGRQVNDYMTNLSYQTEGTDTWNIEWDQKGVRGLMSKLGKANVNVYALDGAAWYALKENHGRIYSLIESVIAYNNESKPHERFGGVRFDIEPYLLPQFAGVKKTEIMREYMALLKTSKKLTAKANMALGVDIPFWFDGVNEYFEYVTELDGRPLSEHIIDIVDDVGIMDYRTVAYGANGIIVHAEGELAYANKKNKGVFIGLETVDLPNEVIYYYTAKTQRDSRVIIRPSGKTKVKVYYIPEEIWKTNRGNIELTREDVVLGESKAIAVPSAKLSFQEKGLEAFRRARSQTLKELGHHKSFVGFITHSYESYRPWLNREQSVAGRKESRDKN